MQAFLPRLAAAALAACAATGALAQEPPRYRVLDINLLTGREDISVTALNNRGDFTFLDYDDNHSYLWRGGRVHDLGTWGGGTMDLNDRGDVVGTRLLDDGRRMTFLWRKDSVIDLAATLRAGESTALSINSRGQAVGMADGRPFLYDGRRTRYLDLPGTTDGAVSDINDAGLIAGTARFVGDTGVDARAFVLRDGMVHALPEPIVFEFSGGDYAALAVNDAGDTVMQYTNYNTSGRGTALYVDGQVFDLGYDSFARDINNRGWAAGFTLTETGPGVRQPAAMLFEGGTGYSLAALMTAAAGERWQQLFDAQDINDRGQVAGSGLMADGSTHAFIATPVPEGPAALSLLAGLAVLGAALRARRREEVKPAGARGARPSAQALTSAAAPRAGRAWPPSSRRGTASWRRRR